MPQPWREARGYPGVSEAGESRRYRPVAGAGGLPYGLPRRLPARFEERILDIDSRVAETGEGCGYGTRAEIGLTLGSMAR